MKTSRLPFINVGFEFTASPNPKTGTNEEYFETLAEFFTFYTPSYLDKPYRHKVKDLPSKFKWIDENYSADTCGCEVPTPVIKKLKDVSRYYNSFKAFTKQFGFTTSGEISEECLGGCHIHLDLSWIKDTELKKRLVINIGKYLTNNPQLNWAFNEVNDNINANSLHIATSNRTGLGSSTGFNDGIGKEYKEFRKDRNPFRAFCFNPLNLDLYKNFCVRYNVDYDTVEFRIFDMPDNLERHLLHYDVAIGIYKHCYKLAVNKKIVKTEIKNGQQVVLMKQTKAIEKLKKSMKEIGVAYKRVKDLEFNINTRYEWSKFVKKNGVIKFKFDSCYLL